MYGVRIANAAPRLLLVNWLRPAVAIAPTPQPFFLWRFSGWHPDILHPRIIAHIYDRTQGSQGQKSSFIMLHDTMIFTSALEIVLIVKAM